MSLGIKVHKSHTSIVLEQYREYLDRRYKIASEADYRLIALKSEIMNLNIPYELINYDFELNTRRKKSLREVLENSLPEDVHSSIPSSFDSIGSIAVIDIKENMKMYSALIGESILQLHPSLKTVYRKSSKVAGPYRIRGLELIAGVDNATTVHKEHGLKFLVDLKNVYFSPRLATEHQRIASIIKIDENVLDLFAAQAPFAFHILKRIPASVTVVDINPHTAQLIEKSLVLNKLHGRPEIIIADAHDVCKQFKEEGRLFDHIIMNHPSGAIEFIAEALPLLSPKGKMYIYAFVPIDDQKEYCQNIIPAGIKILDIHKVRQSSPSENHLCITVSK